MAELGEVTLKGFTVESREWTETREDWQSAIDAETVSDWCDAMLSDMDGTTFIATEHGSSILWPYEDRPEGGLMTTIKPLMDLLPAEDIRSYLAARNQEEGR